MGVGTGEIGESDLEKLFHIDVENLQGRSVPLLPVYAPNYDGDQYRDWDDDSPWYIWVDSGEELTRVRGYPEKSNYFGTEFAEEEDIILHFLEFYVQHLCWPGVLGTIKRIETDVRNLAACMSKIAVYQQLAPASTFEIQPFVITELEYIFATCRSLYDLLQHLSWKMWQGVELFDGGGNELPRHSFAQMALSGDEPLPSEELVESYGIPPSLAEFYESAAEHFSLVRDFRDDIIHYGESIDLIFATEEGFAIQASTEPFSEFGVWDEDTFLENDLAPLWPVTAHVIEQTLGAMDQFTRAFAEDIAVLPRVAPDYNVFLRGHHVTNILHLQSLIEDDVWGEQFINDRGLSLTLED